MHIRTDQLFHEIFPYTTLPVFLHGITILLYIVLILIPLFFIAFCISLISRIKRNLRKHLVFLELTPPAFTEKTAYTTQQLFSVIHSMGIQPSFWNWFLGKKTNFSFEIVSTKTQGIRYVIQTTPEEKETLKHNITSYMPDIKIKEVEDYLPQYTSYKQSTILEFALKNRFQLPLAKQQILIEHDPVAYITGMMTSLKENELIAFQVVVSPSHVNTKGLSQRINIQEDVLSELLKPQYSFVPKLFWFVIDRIISPLLSFVRFCFNQIVDIFLAGSQKNPQVIYALSQTQLIQEKRKPARVISSFEQQIMQNIQEKVDQPLFEATIRIFLKLDNKMDRKQRMQGIKSSFAPFAVPKYQELLAKGGFPGITTKLRSFLFNKRLLSFINMSSTILSASEIADLYHFPFAQTTRTENIVKSLSRELPAPISLKKGNKLDVIFAENIYGGVKTPIGLSQEERRRHMYIIGATGTGKSTMMLSSIKSDIDSDQGICVIDPHGELAEATIACVPERRKKDFVYINPDDLSEPIHINLLELTPGLSEEDSLREKEFIAESIVSLFRKVFSDAWAKSAHRIEYILRNTIHTAFTLENPTLFTLFDLLNDEDFRKAAITNLTDERLVKFWKNEFGKAGDFQRVKMNAGITSKIGRFLFSPSASRLLEHPKSTINFDELINSGKIVVCNLAKGKLGEDTSEVLGVMILTKIQLAALKRAKIPQEKRQDFYVYVDEFQTFATPSFVQMLSEARKYKVCLIMAEQSTSQQKDKNLVHIIIANVGTVICFRTANPEDEQLMLNYFYPYINKGEIINLPSFNFYIKMSAMTPEEPFSGRTILINVPTNGKLIAELIEASRKTYGVPYVKPIQKKIEISATQTVQKPQKMGAPDLNSQ